MGPSIGVGEDGAAATSSALYVAEAPIVRIARSVVAELAPDETDEVFEAARAAWMGDARGWRWRPRLTASVGSGIDGAMVSEVVLGVLTGAFLEVLGKEALTRTHRWRRGRRRGRSPQAAVALPAPPALTGPQLLAMHGACVRHAAVLGLSPAAALLLADAVIGSIGGGSVSGGEGGS